MPNKKKNTKKKTERDNTPLTTHRQVLVLMQREDIGFLPASLELADPTDFDNYDTAVKAHMHPSLFEAQWANHQSYFFVDTAPYKAFDRTERKIIIEHPGPLPHYSTKIPYGTPLHDVGLRLRSLRRRTDKEITRLKVVVAERKKEQEEKEAEERLVRQNFVKKLRTPLKRRYHKGNVPDKAGVVVLKATGGGYNPYDIGIAKCSAKGVVFTRLGIVTFTSWMVDDDGAYGDEDGFPVPAERKTVFKTVIDGRYYTASINRLYEFAVTTVTNEGHLIREVNRFLAEVHAGRVTKR